MLLTAVFAALALRLLSPLPQPSADAGIWNYVPGSTQKVSQLTGDFDRTLNLPTRSETNKRFGIAGTDLGSSFEHRGKLFFLFGDTWGRSGDSDAIAWTRSHDPAKIRLDFHRAKDGKWLPLSVPGITLGTFEIPSGGISLHGKMYVVFTTDWQPDKSRMGRSVLAVSDDDGRSFSALYDLSKTKFINVSLWESEGWLYIFGSGDYRRSSVCLARVKPSEISDRSHIEYFSGSDPAGQPQWSTREEDATLLFPHNAIGEFSVAYCAPARRYFMLYNASKPRGITLRSAPAPWGPWSEGQIIFDPWRDRGYGRFLHIPAKFKSERHDAFADPGREAEWGGEYGPYLMARYIKAEKGQCRLFYTLSTWNPYQVVVMQTDLKLQPSEVPNAVSSELRP